ncbi:MAG: rhodanese-like domain-containing protein, partial [Pseudomonadota bacterium]
AHIPGSRWSIRSRLVADARQAASHRPVLVADDTAIAGAAAIDLAEAGFKDTRLLEGGFAAWTGAGLPVEASPDSPANAACIDFLFFVHGRHSGDREAARQYLAWEMNLMSQLDEQDRSIFRVGPAAA